MMRLMMILTDDDHDDDDDVDVNTDRTLLMILWKHNHHG